MLLSASKLRLVLILGRLHLLLASRSSFYNCSMYFDRPMYRVCNGRLPHRLHLHYRDNYAHDNVPYAIFAPDALMSFVFVTMHRSPIMECKNLTILDFNLFQCDSAQNVKFALSLIFCFIYPFHYVGELTDNCMDTKTSRFRIIENSILHYADVECAGKEWMPRSRQELAAITLLTLLFARWFLLNLACG